MRIARRTLACYIIWGWLYEMKEFCDHASCLHSFKSMYVAVAVVRWSVWGMVWYQQMPEMSDEVKCMRNGVISTDIRDLWWCEVYEEWCDINRCQRCLMRWSVWGMVWYQQMPEISDDVKCMRNGVISTDARDLWWCEVYEEWCDINRCQRSLMMWSVWGMVWYQQMPEMSDEVKCMRNGVISTDARDVWWGEVYEEWCDINRCQRCLRRWSVWGMVWYQQMPEMSEEVKCMRNGVISTDARDVWWGEVYEEWCDIRDLWWCEVHEEWCDINRCQRSLMMWSVWGMVWYQQMPEMSDEVKCMRNGVISTDARDVWWGEVYEEWCDINRCQRCLMRWSVWGMVWYQRCLRRWSVWGMVWYQQMPEMSDEVKCMRNGVISTDARDVWWGEVYEEWCDINRCQRSLMRWSVWGMVWYQQMTEVSGDVKCMRNGVISTDARDLWWGEVYEEWCVISTDARDLWWGEVYEEWCVISTDARGVWWCEVYEEWCDINRCQRSDSAAGFLLDPDSVTCQCEQ